ncbi:hypothetical protein RB195_020445 [Necator americanus]|uniref:Uncharacterized protein n=1 Tax=Necator americanus TaxID=51031 RepID=A0ABR1CIV6_NECAM
MISAGISSTRKLQFIFIDKNIKTTGRVYKTEVLDVQSYIALEANHQKVIYQQQDSAPAHGTKTKIRYLQKKIGSYFTKDQYHANSWISIQTRLFGLRTHGGTVKGQEVTNSDQLEKEFERVLHDPEQAHH